MKFTHFAQPASLRHHDMWLVERHAQGHNQRYARAAMWQKRTGEVPE